MLESSLGASVNSLAMRRFGKTGPPKASLTPISGSLPITMSKPMPMPSMSSVFGQKKDMVSKSWSDLWDEDIEEEEEEADKQLKARQEQNSRTWSHESQKYNDSNRHGGPLQTKTSSMMNIARNAEAGRTPAIDIDADLVADGFFFHDTPQHIASQHSPRYSPPSKRTTFDKWSALGDRRRAHNGASDSERSPEPWKSRRNVGLGFTGFGAGTKDSKSNTAKEKGRECPWAKATKARDHQERRNKDKHVDLGDLEWVGGWQDLHL